MCYKVSTPEKEALEDYFKNRNRSVFIDDYPYYYHANGFDMPWLPTQSIDTPHTIKPANWKLVPNYIKSVASAKGLGGTLNARNDTLTAGKMWKPYTQNRMLLWIDGFYEPHHPAPKVSQPFYIYMPNKEPFTLGGIYNDWVNPDTGEVIRTFAIITVLHNDKPYKVKYEILNAGEITAVNIHMLDEELLRVYGRTISMEVAPLINFDAASPDEVNVKAQVLTFLTDNNIVPIAQDCSC